MPKEPLDAIACPHIRYMPLLFHLLPYSHDASLNAELPKNMKLLTVILSSQFTETVAVDCDILACAAIAALPVEGFAPETRSTVAAL